MDQLIKMVTATFGGLTRDVLSGRPGRILHSFEEIYATTALGGATAYVILHRLKAPTPVRILGGVGTVSRRVHRTLNRLVDKCLHVLTQHFNERRTNGWMNEWMDEWMRGQPSKESERLPSSQRTKTLTN